jgi:hypothetical protein
MPKYGVSTGPERLLAACPERSEISGIPDVQRDEAFRENEATVSVTAP